MKLPLPGVSTRLRLYPYLSTQDPSLVVSCYEGLPAEFKAAAAYGFGTVHCTLELESMVRQEVCINICLSWNKILWWTYGEN